MSTSISGIATTYKIIAAGSKEKTICARDTVTVHARGEVVQADGSGKKFWDTHDAGQEPFTYQAGVGGVITGE